MKIFVLLFITCFMGCSCKENKTTKQSSAFNKTQKVLPVLKNDNQPITNTFVLGKFNYKQDNTFIKVDSKFTNKTIYLQKEVYKSFLRMQSAALIEGVTLKIISGTRNFYEQKAIWERKWKTHHKLSPKQRALKILEYSSMPSTSRHHWGTDLDLNSLNNSYFNTRKGLTEYNWLLANANDYGFYQVYTEKNNGRTGYNLEKWHWSYLPLASQYLRYYNAHITLDDISEFSGSEMAKELNVITTYVNGISKHAKANNN